MIESYTSRLITLPAAIIPGLLLLYFFYQRDLFREPRLILMKTFFWGVAGTIGLLAVGSLVQSVCNISVGGHPLLFGAFGAFILAAVPEEVLKYTVLIRYSVRQPAFDEPMDGVVYGAAASLGFATLENLLYVFVGGWHLAVVRALSAVPAHACTGALMGYYVGRSRFEPNKRYLAGFGLCVAILFHGLYDWPLISLHSPLLDTYPEEVFAVYGIAGTLFWIAVLSLEIYWVLKIVKRLRAAQVQQVVSSTNPA